MPVVLGGGISGLSAAYYLMKNQIGPVTVVEASKRVGGWIRTETHDDKGFLFEGGPRTIRPKGIAAPNTLEMIEELGLDKQIHPIYPNHPAASVRMIYAKNKLHVLPSSLSGMMKQTTLFRKPLIQSVLNDLKAPRSARKMEDESIYDFVERRFGSDIAQYAISPMICGICAGDAKEISVRFLMNDLFEKEQKYGGVIKGMLFSFLFDRRKPVNESLKQARQCKLAKRARDEQWSIYSLKGGLEQLPKTLANTLLDAEVDIKTGAECRKLEMYNDRIILNINGNDVETKHVISSLPSHKLANLVEHQHPSLACMLRTIPYVTVAVVNVQYDSCDLLKEEAFGFLVPPSENLPILGVIFDSCCFSMNRKTVLTIMMGGRWFNEYFGDQPDTKEILNVALKQLKDILRIEGAPTEAKVSILEKCIPQYTVGHKARVENIRNYIERSQLPLDVCGAAYDGVGVNDVIWSARQAVESRIE